MGKSCFDCGKKLGWNDLRGEHKAIVQTVEALGGTFDPVFSKMTKNDVLCMDCLNQFDVRHAVESYKVNLKNRTPEEIEAYMVDPRFAEIVRIAKEKMNLDKQPSQIVNNSTASPIRSSPISSSPTPSSPVGSSSTTPTPQTLNLSKSTSSEQLRNLTRTLHDVYKNQWDKNGVVQIKTPSLAILQRMWGQQVQFIIACDQLSKEGYRLMAIDEGKSGGQASGGMTGGVNAYFYFQKMDYVR